MAISLNCYNIFPLASMQASSRKKNIYSKSLPVNCASEMRRRPPSVYACTGTVMQKAKVNFP